MQWDRFFEDLELQLDGEWEAERAALDTEAERLRFARLALRERLLACIGGEAPIALELAGGSTFTGSPVAVGVDWIALAADAQRARGGIVPLSSVRAVALAEVDLLRAARGPVEAARSLTDRMTFGFVLRDLVRRRVPVTIATTGGTSLTGTLDRAAADHLDVALHDASAPRRRGEVAGYRIVPYTAVAVVRPEAPLRLS